MSEQTKKNIAVEEAFQKSVNIRYDYGNMAKVQDYIASGDSLELLKTLTWATANHATNRANILIGAYGRGKSHLILVLLTLLCAEDRSSCKAILKQIQNYDAELFAYLQDYLENKQRLVPVIISGNSDSISQSFLAALQEALHRERLENLMPDTHFTAASNMITTWKEQYPETYRQFCEMLKEPVDGFMEKIQAFDEAAYKKFIAIYPVLTSGGVFNPFIGFDIVDLYSNVADKVSEFGYDGLYVVYDEFSKYLEANIKSTSIADIKLLQDFAEKCTRSGNKQMHLLLITHKDIHNYIDSLPKEKTDGWRGIAERFEHLEMNGNVEQTYELIGKVIQKDEDYYITLKQNYHEQFEGLKQQVLERNLFVYWNEQQVETLIDACYPLHPVTVFLLPRISEKVAQNERTLFTFLASDQKHTLKEFLMNQEAGFSLLTPDIIYDYFEQQFKKEAQQTEIHRIYMTAVAALKKVKRGSLQEKIIKTLTLIAICNEVDVLPSNDASLSMVYSYTGYSNMDIAEALSKLLKELHLLYRQENSGFLVLKDGQQQNMEQIILDTIEKVKLNYSVEDILNFAMVDNYFYPTKYNEDYAITRYFRFEFVNEQKLMDLLTIPESISGVIYGIVLNSEDSIPLVRTALMQMQEGKQRQVFVLPKEYYDITEAAYRYKAILELKENSVYDGTAREELLFQQDDLEMVLREYFFRYTMPEQLQAEYYYQGRQQSVYRKTQLTSLLSDICCSLYDKTPIINNEMINKDVVQKAIISARNKVVDGLLETHLQPMLGLSGNGPEVSLTRSLLVNNGILEETETGIAVCTHGLADENLQYMFDTIFAFLNQASHEKMNAGVLYEKLILPEHHIGLKKGVIPVFLAAVLHDLKSQVVIEKDAREVELTAELLSSLNENPGAYTIFVENWDEERKQYISALEALFSEFIVEREKQFNGYTYVFKAMQRWFLALPKSTKNMTLYFDEETQSFKEYAAETKALIALMRNLDLGAKKCLFEELSAALKSDRLWKTAEQMKVVKQSMDKTYPSLINGILCSVKQKFTKQQNVADYSVQPVWEEWQEENKNQLVNAALSNPQERVIALLQQGKAEQPLAQELAKQTVGLRLMDWNDGHLQSFTALLDELVDIVEHASNKEATGENDITIEIATEESLSSSAKFLLNDLKYLLEEEYGDAVTNREKRLVIAEILKIL